MDQETINRIEVLDTGELLLGLESGGKSMYQYVYREARGVYWDQNQRVFKSTPMTDWSCSRWFEHIIEVAGDCGIQLALGNHVSWLNIPAEQKSAIENGKSI
jgi:hypothetical protein